MLRETDIFEQLFLGVDLGTSSLKCGLFDLGGRCIAFARVNYPTKAWEGGAEQDAGDWWQALVKAVRLTTRDTSPANIAALGIGGHAPAPVFADAALEPVCPVLLWNDHRPEEQRERLLRSLGHAPRNGPERLMAHIAARAMWLRTAQPHKLAQTMCILHSGDYLVARLTGRCIMTGGITPDILAAGDLSTGLLPGIEAQAGDLVGTITADAAGQLGLQTATPVVTGGLDSFLASFGSGICDPGDACLSTGSSTIVALLTRPREGERFRLGAYSLMSQPVRLGARVLSWAQQCVGDDSPSRDALLHATKVQSPVLDRKSLSQLLQTMKAGDPEGCGLFAELSQRFPGVELYRLILDAILLGQRQVLDELQENNRPAVRVRSVGGLAAYPEFVQLQADALGTVVEVPKTPDSGTLGAAMLAAIALGLYHDHRDAVSRMVGLGQVYRPRDNIAAGYAALFREIGFR